MSSTSQRNRHIVRAIAPITTTLVLIGLTATPSSAHQDAGPLLIHASMPASGCELQRVDTQFVRCDNLTGDGVSAPGWIPALLPGNPTDARRNPPRGDAISHHR